jgi:hypothetical protein
VRDVRATTSMCRAGVKRSCSLDLPRVVGGCEGVECTTALGEAQMLVVARNLRRIGREGGAWAIIGGIYA